MLSMLQQLLEDREAVVREMAVKALALVIAYCDDTDKYNQCEELTMATLNDTSVKVVYCSTSILIPVLAEWSLEIGKLEKKYMYLFQSLSFLFSILGKLDSSLLKYLLHKLNQLVKISQSDIPTQSSQYSDESVIQIINVLNNLLPFILVYVSAVEPVLNRITEHLTIEISKYIIIFSSNSNYSELIAHCMQG